MNWISEPDLTWLAGLLEGEGTFTVLWNSKQTYPLLSISVEMSDKDVIDRVGRITGVGNLTERQPRYTRVDGGPAKRTYRWWLGRKEGCEKLAEMLLPYMGERRAEKIRLMLTVGAKYPQRGTK